jgi:hypothetical protein
MTIFKTRKSGQADPSSPEAKMDALLAEAMRLDRQERLDDAALAQLDARMQQEFGRLHQEGRANQTAKIETRAASPRNFVLPRRFRSPALAAFLFVTGGSVLELTVGQGFIFAWANEYRSIAPWIFLGLLPPFGLGWYFLERANQTLRVSFPTGWVRWLLVFPLAVALSAGMVVVSPLGWAALFGWAAGTPSDQLEAKLVSIGESSPSARSCDQSATLELGGATTRICLEDRISGQTPRAGDTLAIVGRTSALGVFIDEIHSK